MRANSRGFFRFLGVAIAGLAATMVMGTPAQAQVKNAQSVQMNTAGGGGIYEITQTDTWSYRYANKNLALSAFGTYFSMTTSGNPSTTQIENAQHDALLDNRCNFWNGYALAQVVKSFGSKTVTCTPVSLIPYAARTGWDVTSLTSGPATINLTDIFVASESVQVKSVNGSNNKKYSFSLTDELGSRLTDLKAELFYDDGNGPVSTGDVRTLANGLLTQQIETGVDWLYQGNAGLFGSSAAQKFLLDGYVNAIQNGDNFAGNNDLGGSRARINSLAYTLSAPGTYSVVFTGVVKGNSFSATTGFQLTQVIATIGGCQP